MKFRMVTTFYPPFRFGGDATYVRAAATIMLADVPASGLPFHVVHRQQKKSWK